MRTLLFIILCSILYTPSFADEYEVVPHRTQQEHSVRGDFWFSDGAGYLSDTGGNSSAVNRFRLGIDANLGSEYRIILGLTALDYFTSGETSTAVGDISREAMDFDFGYFIVPDKFWLKGELHLEDVHGTDFHGFHGTLGYGAAMGWRFYEMENFNLNLELNYLYVQAASVQSFNFANGFDSTANFPAANVITLSLRMGFNLGGRY